MAAFVDRLGHVIHTINDKSGYLVLHNFRQRTNGRLEAVPEILRTGQEERQFPAAWRLERGDKPAALIPVFQGFS